MCKAISQRCPRADGKMRSRVGRRGFRCGRFRRDGGHDLGEAFEECLAAALELNGAELADAVEHASGQFHLLGKRGEHSVFDGIFGDEVDDRDRADLVFAPRAGDALFQLGGIPREVAIDDDAGILEVEPDSARVGRKKESAVRILTEGEDLGATLLLRDVAGMPCETGAVFFRPIRARARAYLSILKR